LTESSGQNPRPEEERGSLLQGISSPTDLKSLSIRELNHLAEEIRREIICTVAQNGGHLAPSSGASSSPRPPLRLRCAAGHHHLGCGPSILHHKLVTGEGRSSIPQAARGISGFPRPSESPYDGFGTGHASTSVSAALGLAVGRAMKKEGVRLLPLSAMVMTGGMAFEGLNQAGYLERDLIVVLNDNEMSIARNVGALSSFLSRKKTSKLAVRLKRRSEPPQLGSGDGRDILQLVRRVRTPS